MPSARCKKLHKVKFSCRKTTINLNELTLHEKQLHNCSRRRGNNEYFSVFSGTPVAACRRNFGLGRFCRLETRLVLKFVFRDGLCPSRFLSENSKSYNGLTVNLMHKRFVILSGSEGSWSLVRFFGYASEWHTFLCDEKRKSDILIKQTTKGRPNKN